MNDLTRFGVSVPHSLLKQFDQQITRKGYENRSEALRDLIRQYLLQKEIESDAEVAGAITLVYDHHVPNLSNKLDDLQHSHFQKVLSKTHIHLDHHNCLEVILLKGKRSEIEQLAERIISAKGVKHGKLTFTSTGKNLPGR